MSREQAADSWPIRETVYSNSREYTRASTLNMVTSELYAAAVTEAFSARDTADQSAPVNAYSPVIQRRYTMRCELQPDITVLCTVGDNARVFLW